MVDTLIRIFTYTAFLIVAFSLGVAAHHRFQPQPITALHFRITLPNGMDAIGPWHLIVETRRDSTVTLDRVPRVDGIATAYVQGPADVRVRPGTTIEVTTEVQPDTLQEWTPGDWLGPIHVSPIPSDDSEPDEIPRRP